MVHRILIFKIFFLIFLSSNTLYAKTIIGKPKIIDGDTININKNKIRLHGIDAPEINQKCFFEKKEWSCGKQSTIELKRIVNNKIISCVTNDIDRYNRYIAICYVGKINLNKIMVKNGWAIAYRYYSMDYVIDEGYAMANKLGMWKGEFENPYLYRKRNK